MYREGVQFVFEYVVGLHGKAISKNADTTFGGSILADMGYDDHFLHRVFVAMVDIACFYNTLPYFYYSRHWATIHIIWKALEIG